MLARRRTDRVVRLGAAALVLAVAVFFFAGALPTGRGYWPVPLDDAYIHFDFARALAKGHPFEWIAGQGYSSGETAPLWALALAPFAVIGLDGPWLGACAALLSLLCAWDLARSVDRLISPARWPARLLAGAMIASVGVVQWSLWSGMETALFGALAGRMILAAHRAIDAPPALRASRALRVGLLGALVVLVRPEAPVLIAPLALAVARGARSRSALAQLARASLPGAAVTVVLLCANRLFSGDALAAGARLKLLASNPYLSDLDRAREFTLNIVHAYLRVLRVGLSAVPWLWFLLPSLGLAALLVRRRRSVAMATVVGALAWALLVSTNGAARYQNFRYYVPALLLLLVAAAMGLAALDRGRLRPLGRAVAVCGVLLAWPRLVEQRELFVRACRNIRDQQVEMGLRVAQRTPPGARLLVGDAGAIAYVSKRSAIDALGLGGFQRLPFARAAVQGEGAIVELLEHVDATDRPAFLALYPNWFGALTSEFGRELDRVTITDNVIGGGTVKILYAADFRPLGAASESPPSAGVAVDELDVADVLSEAAHRYVSPAPYGGATIVSVRSDEHGRRRFDGGRVIPEGREERFESGGAWAGRLLVLLRSDEAGAIVDVRVVDRGAALRWDEARIGAFVYARGFVDGGVRVGDAVTLSARAGTLRDLHVWLVGVREVLR